MGDSATDSFDRQDLFVDLWKAPEDWGAWVASSAMVVERVEPQPIADQIKLHKCANVPEALPNWLRRGAMY